MYGYRHERRKIAKMMGLDYLALGILGQIAGLTVIDGAGQANTFLGISGQAVLVLFTGLLIGGCTMYARYHRMSRSWGLVGLLSALGVFILVAISLLRLIERRNKHGQGFGVIFAEPYRRHVWRMDIKVKLDQTLGPVAHEPIMVQLARGANVGTAMKTLAGVIPELNDGELPGANYRINGRPADRRSELSDGDELAVLLNISEPAPHSW